MALHAALAAAAALLAIAFALSTLERWLARGKKHELMWTISLAMFALGSLGLWAGASLGWSEWTFKGFYLFGAILNVPFLALGSVYLLGRERAGDWATGIVALLCAFAAGIVIASPINASGAMAPDVLPQGSAVFGVGPRIAAAVASAVPALVIITGAVWSAGRLLRRRGRGRPARELGPGRLALANLLIAAGTLVLGAGGAFNSVLSAMDAFAISLVAGIALIFAGFLLTSTPTPARPVEPWHLPPELASERAATSAETPRLDRHDAPRLEVSDPRPGSPTLN